jgi:hypothetical protein
VGTFDSQLPNNRVGETQFPPAPPAITSAMTEYLKQTKPWVRFISILLFIGIGLLVLGGLVIMISAGAMSSGGSSPFGAVPAALIGSIYAVLGLLYFFPALFLFRYADGIKKALTVDLVGGMEDALRNQKSFWRFLGILMLIILIVEVIAVVVLILAFALGGFGSIRS